MLDAIIIGLGSMGSSSIYELAKSGIKVLGIEQFGIGHKKGSYSGATRIVRKAYFEHLDYVPLLKESYKGWNAIQIESGEVLFKKTGLVYYGEKEHPIIEGVQKAAQIYQINLLEGNDYVIPQFSMPSNFHTLFESDAGFVFSEKTIKTYSQIAKSLGAEIHINEKVSGIKQRDGMVTVTTYKNDYKCKKLIVTSGVYYNQLFENGGVDLSVTRQLIIWIEPKNVMHFQLGEFPCWMISDPSYEGVFYGFPIAPTSEYGGNGWLKVAHHLPGERISPNQLNNFNPNDERVKIESILKKYMPDALGEVKSVSACMYANTDDGHFVIDYLPGSNQQIIIAGGFSGHGFKFVPVVGKILRDMILEGKSSLPIDFLSINRFR